MYELNYQTIISSCRSFGWSGMEMEPWKFLDPVAFTAVDIARWFQDGWSDHPSTFLLRFAECEPEKNYHEQYFIILHM